MRKKLIQVLGLCAMLLLLPAINARSGGRGRPGRRASRIDKEKAKTENTFEKFRNGESTIDGVEVSNGVKIVECRLEQTTVELGLPRENGFIYFPTTVKVNKCVGNCCLGVKTCKAGLEESRTIQVLKIKTNSENAITNRDLNAGRFITKTITVDKGCTCNKCHESHNCEGNRYLKFSVDICNCVCTNREEEETCYQKGKTHRWNPNNCECECTDKRECSSQHIRNKETCECEGSFKNALNKLLERQ